MLIGVVVGFVICGAIYGAYYYGTKTSQVEVTPQVVQQVESSPAVNQVSPTTNQPPSTGTIEGSVSYPSEGIPTELKVCVYNLDTEKVLCEDNRITDSRFTYGQGYRVVVEPGEYHVYATLQGGSGYKAYYSEAVLCGLNVNCTNHNPIVVQVAANQLLTDIDPADWYDASQN